MLASTRSTASLRVPAGERERATASVAVLLGGGRIRLLTCETEVDDRGIRRRVRCGASRDILSGGDERKFRSERDVGRVEDWHVEHASRKTKEWN